MISAVLRQLDAVAVEYWQLVAERGKLLAAADHLEYCQMMFDTYGQQGELATQVQAAYDSSLAKHQEASKRAAIAQQRVLSLVNDDEFSQNVELITADLPQSMRLETLERAISTAKKNRVDAQASPGSLALDVQTAHQQLKFAVQNSNRLLKSVAKISSEVALVASGANRSVAEQLMVAITNQDRLRDSQSAFLDAVANQQKAVISMRRAKGTLIRTKRLGAITPVASETSPRYDRPAGANANPNSQRNFQTTMPRMMVPQSTGSQVTMPQMMPRQMNAPRTSSLPPQRGLQFELPRLSWKPVPKGPVTGPSGEVNLPTQVAQAPKSQELQPSLTSKYRNAAKRFLAQFGKPMTPEQILAEAELSN